VRDDGQRRLPGAPVAPLADVHRIDPVSLGDEVDAFELRRLLQAVQLGKDGLGQVVAGRNVGEATIRPLMRETEVRIAAIAVACMYGEP
jgi:hypothetical protein